MAECLQCKTALNGTWNMTSSGASCEKTGRYLGVTNGYMFYDGNPNWVYCYCLNCFKTRVIDTAKRFAPDLITINQQIINETNNLQQQKGNLTAEIATLQQQKGNLTAEIATLQQQKENLTAEITTLQQLKTQLTTESTNQQKQKEQQTTEINTLQQQIDTLQTSVNKLKQQIDEVLDKSGASKLSNMVEQFSETEAKALKDVGFDRSAFTLKFQNQVDNTAKKFVQMSWEELLGNIKTLQNKLLQDIEKSETATATTETTLTSAGVPVDVISASLANLKAYIEIVRANHAKWVIHSSAISSILSSQGVNVQTLGNN